MRHKLAILSLLLVAAPVPAEVIDIRQGTNIAVAVDPTGELIMIDLLGGLWRLPASGGGATALIPAGSGIAQPRFDRSGQRVVFQRWVDGQWDLWQLTLANGRYEALTETATNEREPDYSPDGSEVVFASDRSGEYRIWSLDLESGALRQLTDEPGTSRYPSFADSGELAYVHHIGDRSSVRLYSGGPRGSVWIDSDRRLDAPSWRPGGDVLVFNERVAGISSDLALFIDADEPVRRRLTRNEDVFVGRPGWLSPAEYIYAADGQLWRRRIASTERTPVHLFAGANVDSVAGAPVEIALDAPGPHPIAGITGTVEHAATRRQAFSALGNLWLIDDGELRRLTNDAATDAWPDFTPDGEWLIFASDRGGKMELWRLRIESGQLLRLTEEPGRSFLPRVSPDGSHVAFLTTPGYGPWDAAALKVVEIAAPFRSRTIATGLFDASDLSWQGADLRVLARAGMGSEALPRVFAAVADPMPVAPVTSQAELPSLAGFSELQWQPASADAPYVIQAGRIFDGIGTDYTYLVDIHIEGQRITDVVRRGQLPLPERVIDASELTALPGLIDVHAHHSQVAGSEPGRLWLRNGVTTVREAMTGLAAAVERAETWASGQQPGPRLIIAPNTPDTSITVPAGSPIVIAGQRVADSLSHGLAEQGEREAVQSAALPPVVRSGTATGLTLTVSTLGRSYQDVISQFGASGQWLPTGLAALEAARPAAGMSALTGTIERVMRSSGRIAIGSEAPAVAYGAGFHDELALLAEQGIPIDQILRWATAGGALALGLSLQTGTVEPGRLADLILVDGDPLDDIDELRQIQAVVKGGVWIEAASLGASD